MAIQHEPESIDTLPEAVGQPEHGYWRSLAEAGGAADLSSEDEFPATSADQAVADPLSRRNFFQLMGASMALAGVAGAGCKRWEKDYIVPLARRPEDQVPGNTQQYASVFELGGVGQALLVTSFEGRPIKIDGNPEHPFAGGGTVPGTKRHGASTPFAQASILGLYDPDRSKAVLQGGKGATLDVFKAWLSEHRAKLADGGKLRVLAEASSSPTIAALRRQLAAKLPAAQWHEWESLSWDNEREGMRLAFGRPVRPLANLAAAATIVSIDGDLFSEHPASLRYARDFARGRRATGGSLGDGQMNRLWAIESVFTGTGASADHRLPLRAELALPLLQALEGLITGGAAPTAEFLGDAKVKQFVEVLGEELRANRGRAILIAGRRQPPAVHALVAKLNDALGARGATLDYLEDPQPERASHAASIAELSKAIAAGAVETLIILGGNPVYDAPADLEFGAALAKVATTIHLSDYVNETSAVATWHLPRAHALEAWTDARTYDGTITIGQPLLQPMYGGLAASELVSLLVGAELGSDDLVRATFDQLGGGGLGGWNQAVHDGFVAGTQLPVAQVTAGPLSPVGTTETQRASRLANGQLEVVFVASPFTHDGRFANNGWLQETPDFLTKVTWDNYALVSPATATELGLENDTIIKVELGGRSVEVACYTMPGQARYSIGLVLGGGRTHAGKVGGAGTRTVGFDTGKVRSLAGLDIAGGAKVSSTGKSFTLANTQEHWDMRAGLDPKVGDKGTQQRLPVLVREADLGEINDGWKALDHGNFKPDDFFTEKNGRGKSLFVEQTYKGHQWAMATDLSTCVACNSCLVACVAENNIPVVGKAQVIKNREMNWIRIDRYFKGPVDDPEIASQPVGRQQCENAPCEQVCPVGATVHSDEGLNDMAYNRCVGTRYCSNNCPYKVRRFNFFDYQEEFHEARNKVRQLLFNPEVTVRGRGVMEKCTFCVQRIQNGKIKAKREGRQLTDGELTTACQDACPTESIVFGDLADKTSRVAKLHQDQRAYGLLDDVLYTRPRNQYLAKVRNPHPKLAKAKPAAHGGAPNPAGGH